MLRDLKSLDQGDMSSLSVQEYVKFGEIKHKILPLTVEELYEYVPQIVGLVSDAEAQGLELETMFDYRNIVSTVKFLRENAVELIAYAASLDMNSFLALMPAKAVEVAYKVVKVNLEANKELLKNFDALTVLLESLEEPKEGKEDPGNLETLSSS